MAPALWKPAKLAIAATTKANSCLAHSGGERGGLDAQTRALLRKEPSNLDSLLVPGTLIAREWKGERHEVEATENGFLYKGQEWRSLSEVARSIAGTRRNGPKFFGLRKAK